MSTSHSIFAFDWQEARGLDLHLIAWESRAASGELNPPVLEMSQALYAAFIELRKIHTIMAEGRPGIDHSFYQYRFELFAHNHFLSIAATRVIKILRIAWPTVAKEIEATYGPLLRRVRKYRDALEHQTEIGQRKVPQVFVSNLTSTGYVSEGNAVSYEDLEELLNAVMARVEANAGAQRSAT
jgi:hypothetical protein